jgi:hypothetical protein
VAAKLFFETNASVTVQSRGWPPAPAAFRPPLGTYRDGMPFTIPPPTLSTWAGLPALANGIAFALLLDQGGAADVQYLYESHIVSIGRPSSADHYHQCRQLSRSVVMLEFHICRRASAHNSFPTDHAYRIDTLA